MFAAVPLWVNLLITAASIGTTAYTMTKNEAKEDKMNADIRNRKMEAEKAAAANQTGNPTAPDPKDALSQSRQASTKRKQAILAKGGRTDLTKGAGELQVGQTRRKSLLGI